tara:strand:- start:85 stop:336 length:252 start_codon:yes stop_codon:yes gene_type:complete
MADKKKSEEKTTEEEVKSLRSELNSITFKNKQAKDIAAMQKGEQKLKDKLARNRERRVGGATKISGLGRLGGLATFKQKYKDY